MGKIKQRIISVVAALLLLLNSFVPLLASPVYAQEASPSAEITDSSPQPTATPEPLPSPTPSSEPSPSPSLIPSMDEILTTLPATQSAVIDISTTENQSSATLAPPLWQTNSDSSVTTTSSVVLDQTYKTPQNDKVTITFTRLPESSGTVTAKEIKLTEEQIKKTGALSDTAYEITSTMVDGTFEYTLTLPVLPSQNVEVKYSEDGQNFTDVTGGTIAQDTITISGLTHFTIFVVAGTINDNNEVSTFDESEAEIVINEFVFDDNPEWIEIYNKTSEAIDISDWKICELTSTGNENCYDLPVNSILANSLIVKELTTKLNNSGDTIRLRDDGNNIVDQVTYKEDDEFAIETQDVGNVDDEWSVGRMTDGEIEGAEIWRAFSQPTKGYNNDAQESGNSRITVGEIYAYTSIQDAIDSLEEGGTIHVAEGEYEENLEIEQSLTLLGDPGDDSAGPGGDAPTIFGNCDGDPVVSVEANNVTVSGLIIIEDGCYGSNIYINGSTSGATISDNDINEASYYGVELGSGSSDNQILRNLIHDNEDYGIYNNGSTNTTITNNDIYYNNGGIGMGGSGDISGTQITNNNIHENYNTGIYVGGISFSDLTISNNSNIDSNEGYGIYFDGVTEAELTISGNSITNNYYEGVYIQQVDQESTVDILNNTITGNGQNGEYAGIYINYVYDSIVNIQENEAISNNTRQGIYLCSEGQCLNSTLDVSANTIEGNSYKGIELYNISSTALNVENNDILSNGSSGFELNYIGGGETTPSSLTLSSNTIEENSGYGIYLGESDSVSEITIGATGEGNTISGNSDTGIYLGSVTNASIVGNTITNNGTSSETTGIVVNQAQGNEAHNNIISGNNVGVNNQDEDGDDFDARENYWGSILGPLHELLNPEGEGDSVSDNVLFRPFFLDEPLETLSTNEVDPQDLASLLDTGSFSIPEGEDSEAASEVNVNEDLTINVSDSGGTSSVVLPSGTVITNEDGTIDVSDLTSDDVSESSLAGLGTGVVVDGALQWGLDNIELTFSQQITLNIFVGTDLNGQTLNVVRSTTGEGGWTSDGIGPPTTCVVTNGLCTFTATKASFYATIHTSAPAVVATSATQALSSASGSVPAPTCSDTKPGSAPTLLSATSSGANQVTLTWSKAKDPVTYYLITYGLSAGSQQYGHPNVGGTDTISYTVQGLSGGTRYYFKVRAGNGCMPGDFSNELSTTPSGGFISGPAAGFAPGVLGAKTKVEEQKVIPTPASTPQLQTIDIQLEQPQASEDNLFSRILGFIFSLFKGLFGR